MILMHDDIKKTIAESIHQAILEVEAQTELKVEDIYRNLSQAPNLNMGHFAFPCFLLAKQWKKAPPQIAQLIHEKLGTTDYILEAKVMGPYLNLILNFKNICHDFFNSVKNGSYFERSLIAEPKKTMIEYFQPNTHKEVHVGHLRNLCLGETIVHLHKYSGYDIVTCTYPGDSGTHVAKVIWYLNNFKPEIPETNKGEWLGEIYSKANNILEEQLGTDKEDQNRAELTEILKQIHDENGPSFDLWNESRTWSIDHMKEICEWAHVDFDHWYFESQVDAPSMAFVKELYEQGKLTKDDGAIGMSLEDEKLGFCILIKSDGNGLYATKDVELARRKFEDYGIEKSIYVVDQRQSFHFKQVFKTLEKIGYEQAKDCYHLAYEFVELPDGAISSRKGNIVSGQTLIDSMESTIKEQFLSKYEDWSDEKKQQVAHEVAQGAIKYGMLCVDNNKKIVFDMKEWLKMDGESGPYIQYAHARINSLVDKIGLGEIKDADYSLMTTTQEAQLILQLLNFNHIIENACEKYQTSMLTSYLYDLSKSFNSFYSQCPVGNADSEELKKSRTQLCEVTAVMIKKGLELLGIPAPQRM